MNRDILIVIIGFILYTSLIGLATYVIIENTKVSGPIINFPISGDVIYDNSKR